MLFVLRKGVGVMYEKIELLVYRKWAKFRRSWFMRYFISSIVERIMLMEEDIWIDNWEEERELRRRADDSRNI